jgi:anthranilate phosphoribosyltransferase
MSLDCRLSFPVDQLPTFLPASPFLFLFAPHYHPSLAHIAPIRRQLNFRTIFNVLGPLINPAKPGRMLLGVAKQELGDTFAEVLKLLGVERALVVCGKEGLDEVSIAGETWVSLASPSRASFTSYKSRATNHEPRTQRGPITESPCRLGGSRTARLLEAPYTPQQTLVSPPILYPLCEGPPRI